MPKLIRKTLAEITAHPVSTAEQARLRGLAKRPDAALDLTDPTEISDADVRHGRARVVPHGGARAGAYLREIKKVEAIAGSLGTGQTPVSIKRMKAGARFAMARGGSKGADS